MIRLLRIQVLENLKENNEHQKKTGSHAEVLTKLSPGVKHDLNLFLYAPVLRAHPFFQTMSEKALRKMVSALTVKLAARGDVPKSISENTYATARGICGMEFQ